MTGFVDVVLTEFEQNTAPELIAVILAVVYLVLAVRRNIACWYAAFISTAIFLYVFWQVNLYMESGLQVYYLAMAVYGWYQWQVPAASTGGALRISTWSPRHHLAAVSFILAATLVSGSLLAGTDQRLGYLDSFTTWGAIIATYMVTRKILENWIYWLVIDAASIYLYVDRELYFTAMLFIAYLIIICFGLHSWLKEHQAERRIHH